MAITIPDFDVDVAQFCLYYPTPEEFEGADGDQYPALVLRPRGYDVITNAQICDLVVFTEAGTFVKSEVHKKDAGEINPGFFSNTPSNVVRRYKETLINS